MVTLDVELSGLLSRQITMLDEAILAQINSDPQMEQHSKILRSIPGVGPVLCAALIGEMPELGAIGERQIAALAGLAPINRENGRMDARRSIKGGSAIIRSQLYQAALVATTHNKPLKAFAERLRERGKPHKVVLDRGGAQTAYDSQRPYGQKPALAYDLNTVARFVDTLLSNFVSKEDEMSSNKFIGHCLDGG